jgi:hypothetical protein
MLMGGHGKLSKRFQVIGRESDKVRLISYVVAPFVMYLCATTPAVGRLIWYSPGQWNFDGGQREEKLIRIGKDISISPYLA